MGEGNLIEASLWLSTKIGFGPWMAFTTIIKEGRISATKKREGENDDDMRLFQIGRASCRERVF